MMMIFALLTLLFTAAPLGAGEEVECQALYAELEVLLAEIDELCEEPCDADDCEPMPDESCPDSDACVFSDGFESGDLSEWN